MQRLRLVTKSTEDELTMQLDLFVFRDTLLICHPPRPRSSHEILQNAPLWLLETEDLMQRMRSF